MPLGRAFPSRPPRARAAFVVAATLFLAGQAGFNLAVRNDWLPVRDPVYAEKIAVYRAWSKGSPAASVRIVALGSSRTEMAFRPSVVEAALAEDGEPPLAFNFGISGGVLSWACAALCAPARKMNINSSKRRTNIIWPRQRG